MKKAVIILMLLTVIVSPVYALSEDGRTDKGWLAREGYVMGRGLANILGSPWELVRTLPAEFEKHSRLWPITYLPRAATNIVLRIASGAHDFVFFPFYAPFTDDLSPMTEPFDIPEYPWQKA